MTVLINARVTATGSRDEIAGTDLGWPKPTAALAPPVVPGFGLLAASVTLDGSAPLQLATAPVMKSWSHVVEIVVGWDVLAAPATILGGTFPISIRLLEAEPDEDNGANATIEATVHTNGFSRVLRGTMPTPTTAVAIAVVAVGPDAVLALDGTVVDRRPMGAGTLLAWPGIEGPILIGGAAGSTEPFTGRLWAARFSNAVPDELVQAVTEAADNGMGELDAYFEEAGGAGGPLGEITQSEQVFGGVHWREHAKATLCWSAWTGAHDVRGPFRDHYSSLGGALGSLGLPSSDELSMTAYLDLVDSKRRKAGSSGLRLEDVLVEEVPQVTHVLDVDDVPAGILSAETEVTNDVRARSLADEISENPVRLQAARESLPSALVNARTLSLAPVDQPIPVTVLELFGRLTDQTARFRTSNQLRQFDEVDDVGEGIQLDQQNQSGQQNQLGNQFANKQRLRLPVRHDGAEVFDADVQRDAHSLATAFVRNADVSAALTAWSVQPETTTELSTAPTLIADMIAAADRSDRVTRIVDDHGIGYILQGPRVVRFERGAIIWAPGPGAIALFSDILLHWLRHGGSDGFLGMPVSADDTVGEGRKASFAGGIVVWSPSSGVHEVHGSILGLYLSLGGPTGTLGFPTSDEEEVRGLPGAKRSSFQNGDIYWTADSGAHVLRGDIRATYLHRGGPDKYGVPVTDEVSRKAADGSGVEVRLTTFSTGAVLAWADGIGVFDHVVLDVGSVRSGEIDDEETSDDQPELFVFTTIWVDGVQVLTNRTPQSGSGPTQMTLDAIAPVTVPLHAGATVRIEIQAWDEDTGPDDHFATHDLTYSFEDGVFGWLSAQRGSHIEAPSTWDSPDASADAFKASYTLAPPFDEMADFGRFRQDMWWSFENFSGPDSLGWQMFADTFEDVLDTSGSKLVDDALHPVDSIFYSASYKGVAKKGNCMGMGLLAANTFYHRSGLTEPLIAFGETDALHVAINRAHGIQTGDAATIYKLLIKGVPGWLDPRQIFNRVKFATDRNTPVLLNMRGDDPSSGDNVGHSTLAYRADDSSWPHRIWICDPNKPVKDWADDDGSRIEIDQDGAFRMYAKGEVRDTYGAGAFSGTIGDSYLYEFPISVLQGPHYTPDWVMAAGLAVLGSIMQFVGDAEVRQVSGGGRRLFGDQRGRARSSLESTRAQLEAGLSARLLQADDVVPAVSPTPGLARFAMSTALANQISRLTAPSASVSLTEAVAQLDPTVVTAVQRAWAGQLADGIGSAIADLGERLATIDDSIDIGAIFDATERLFTPGAWPEMAFIEREDAEPGEMFVHQGALPGDLSFDLLGRGGGQFSHWVNTRQAGAMVAGELATGAHSTLRFDRLSSFRPGVRVETDQAATQVRLALTVAAYEDAKRWVGWDTTVTAAAGAPAASLVRAEVPLGVTITSGAGGGAAILRSGERIGSDVRPMTSWVLPNQTAGERLRVEPADAASPFGAVQVQRDSADGEPIDRVVIEPMG